MTKGDDDISKYDLHSASGTWLDSANHTQYIYENPCELFQVALFLFQLCTAVVIVNKWPREPCRPLFDVCAHMLVCDCVLWTFLRLR